MGAGSAGKYAGGSYFWPEQMLYAPSVSFTDQVGNASKFSSDGTNNLSPAGGSVVAIVDQNHMQTDLVATTAANWVYFIVTANADL